MLSPVKAITVGAIVFAIGGSFLIAQPFDQQGDDRLGAAEPQSETDVPAIDSTAPAWVSGTIPWVGQEMGLTEIFGEEGVSHTYNEGWTGMRAEMSDPRISGEMTSLWNNDRYHLPGEDSINVSSGIYVIENEGGRWASTSSALVRGLQYDTVADAAVLVGEDGYEGLIAYLVFDFAGYGPSSPATVEGAIVPGSLPPVPTLEGSSDAG